MRPKRVWAPRQLEVEQEGRHKRGILKRHVTHLDQCYAELQLTPSQSNLETLSSSSCGHREPWWQSNIPQRRAQVSATRSPGVAAVE